MREIHGASKAKRIKFDSPQNIVSWAYMKQLREKDKTMRVYEEDPYIEVYRFRDNLYGLFNQNCDGAGDVWQYVLIGPEKAMLIDTAYGLGRIDKLVERLTGGMPLIVVNTHTGPDHVLGNYRFDRVYCLDLEEENIRNKCQKGAFDYLFDEAGNNIWLQFDKADLPEYREYELTGVPDGHVFHLGEDYDVEIIWTGGHQPGHAVFLDRKGRNLFAGDCVCSDVISCGGGPRINGVHDEYRNVQTYYERLELLCRRLNEFDSIFPGHFMVDLESHVLLNIKDTLQKILDDPDDYDEMEKGVDRQGNPRITYYKQVKGFGTVSYTAKGVYRNKEWKKA